MLPTFGRKPRHHMVTGTVGGQVGKSTLVLNLAAYLSSSANSSTVMIVDAAAPEVSLFDCFRNMFQLDASDSAFLLGSEYVRAPRLNDTSTRQLLVVKADRARITTWEALVKTIEELQYACVRVGFELTHVITETNLQPTAIDAGLAVSDMRYQSLAYWTVWNRQSLASLDVCERLLSYEQQAAERDVRLFFVHNPYQEVSGWDDESYMPALRRCYNAPSTQVAEPANRFVQLCHDAEHAHTKGLSGNDFWDYVYSPYIKSSGVARPLNLLPVFQRSPVFNQYMLNMFANAAGAINGLEELEGLLDSFSDTMYSKVFKNYFRKAGAI